MSIFRIPKGDNLVTYYMLPLVGVNKVTFGRHFKHSYIDATGLKVYVCLRSNMTSPTYKRNPNYITEVVINRILYIQFVFPSKFLKDSKLFIQGKYSKMSKEAKKLIYATSTLPYNSSVGTFTVSHPVLQALDRTKTLRTYLSGIIGEELSFEDELMQAPDESWFIESQI
jgi:hypothetical protein